VAKAPVSAVELPLAGPIAEQPRGFDLLRLPGLRRFLRWRYARLAFQLPLLILALVVLVDGFTGRQLAPRNVATTSVWLHYRGLVVLALALVGNAFCAACPLMLTRGATKRLERLLPRKLEWPRALRSKALVAALMFFYFFAYEYFDLWASPWLTAWLVVGYFGAALAVDTLFKAGTFCRWVCPLGNFNFVFASASPTQVTAINHDVCRACEHKPCLQGRYSAERAPTALPLQTNGSREVAFIPLSEVTRPNGQGHFPGCETELFVPAMQSNMDCTNCFNCVRACPYDNVAVSVRAPGWEWTRAPWARRGKVALMVLGVLLAFWGLLNAVGMIGPYFALAQALADALATESELVVLGLLFVGVTGLGLGVTVATASLADALGGAEVRPWRAFLRWGYALVALGFGFWAAHYLFHFLTGAVSIVPVMQHFLMLQGLPVDPNWRLAQLVPSRFLFPVTAIVTLAYATLALAVTVRVALRDFGRRGVLAMWPMLLFVLAFTAFSIWVLGQPMEMRGTVFGPTF
jgi:polyferredoxin